MIAIQVVTVNGKTMDKARWEVDPPEGLQEGQSFALNVKVNDKGLVSYLSKVKSADCMLDRDKEGHFVMLSFKVARIRHMLNVHDGKVESMVVLAPVNKSVELVLQHALDPSKADPRFVKAVREALPG